MKKSHAALLLVNLGLIMGGYINTSLDLCADLIGAVLGLLYIRCRYLRDVLPLHHPALHVRARTPPRDS